MVKQNKTKPKIVPRICKERSVVQGKKEKTKHPRINTGKSSKWKPENGKSSRGRKSGGKKRKEIGTKYGPR